MGVDAKHARDLAKRQQARMERRAVQATKRDVQLVTMVAWQMLRWASRIPMNRVIGQAISCAASIVRLTVPVSQQTKGCFRPREAKKTGRWSPPRHALLQRVMIRLVVSLHWLQDDEGEVS